VAFPLLVLLVLLAVACGSLAVAALALAHVVGAWAILFFYVAPAIFFFVWTVRELAPGLWRRTASPLRWSWRHSRLAGSPVAALPPLPPPRREAGRGREPEVLPRVLRAAVGPWMLSMRLFLAAWRTPRARQAVNAVFGLTAVAILAAVAFELSRAGWPLHRASALLTAASAAFFLTAFGLKALGWQRLFRPFERPRSLSLAAATGAASVAGLALPGRFDDAVRIAILRRTPGRRPAVGTLVFSLFLLGMIDAGALVPFASAAAIASDTGRGVRVGMGIVAFGGVGATVLVAALPRIRAGERARRHRVVHWLGRHAPASPRDATWAWVFVTTSWLARAAGIVILLDALGFGLAFSLGVAYLAAGAAAGALPIGPAGAATQAGVGAAVLATAGLTAQESLAFAVAAQALTVLAGGAVFAYAMLLHGVSRLRAGRTARRERHKDSF
jgi:hypothetical protein